ncbi:transcriptional regulator, LacI family [Rhizobium sp. NFR07]|uniref:LacI family DNA-binding transcriptional regulator n=1 Tax=Rhizobium sp. NFR07 TaxID=1566262 RepID=UPI0008F20D89|nr:LacI family DNA-binding transcriptional regulator [Rhizobium sp. NFR07]SFB18863.1 transcriptional regulator, LacI family [Rhizobium sp. NFR07]
MNINRPLATMTAIAEALGVSAATVSNALSGKGRVSVDLAASIKAKAEEIGYVPSQAAKALRTGRSGVIGLVLPDISNPLFPQIAQAIEHAASAAGYAVLIGDSRGQIARQTEAIARLLERGVDGVIIIPRRGSRVVDIGAPVAIIDSPSTPGNTVSADHWEGGVQMGRYLASLGHRRVLLIGQSTTSNVQVDRLGGLKAGLGPDVRRETLWVERREAEIGAGQCLGLSAKVAEGFTAFAASSDLLALRVLTELQRSGIDVPRQASVSGFDDLVWSSVVTPQLTTMRQDLDLIARNAVAALGIGIGNKDTSVAAAPMAANGERIAMQLIVRQSTAAPVAVPEEIQKREESE